MSLGRIAYALALVAVLSVLAIFFFPSMQGPYSVVHGPVTALLSLRAATMARNAIVRAGQSIRQNCARISTVVLPWSTRTFSAMEFPASLSLVNASILRC